jgi:hypothetical protein
VDVDRTREVLAALEREGVRYAVFGGVALTLHGLARATEDLEIERVDFDGIHVSVVTARTLYRMKRDTIRARDRSDAERLRRRFKFEHE